MKTALVLSGGGSRGAYEVGVWQALRELGIQIDIVTGTSIGSMNAAFVTLDMFEEARRLWLELNTEEVFDYKHAVGNRGVRFTDVKDMMAEYITDEALRASRIEMGVVVVKKSGMQPLHCWRDSIPAGKMLDYVFASCSCFPVVAPYEIDGVKYLDGGYADNMPIGMTLEKNPDKIIAVDLDGFGKTIQADIDRAKDKLMIIESKWNLGLFPVFNPKTAAKIMRLGYLDAMKAFGAFCGSKFTFVKGEFTIKQMKAMEEAGDCLDMDPGIVYTKSVFLEKARQQIALEKRKSSNVKELGEKISLLALCDLLKKNPNLKIPVSLKKVLAGRIAAAEWLIAEGLV